MMTKILCKTFLVSMALLSLIPSMVISVKLKSTRRRKLLRENRLDHGDRRELSSKGKGTSYSSYDEDEDDTDDSSYDADDCDDEDDSSDSSSSSSSSSSDSSSSSSSKYSKYSKKSKNSSSESGKSSKSSKGCREPDIELEDEFTTFFFVLYGVDDDATEEEFEEAASALVIAYNRIAPFNIVLENAFLFDAYEDVERRRHLLLASDSEDDETQRQRQRDLQFGIGREIQAGARCNGCGNQATLSNQITGNRRFLSSKREKGSKGKGSKSIPICEPGPLPTEEELRLEYNIVLEELRGPVSEAIELEEIDRPTRAPTRAPTCEYGKGSKGSKSCKSSGYDDYDDYDDESDEE